MRDYEFHPWEIWNGGECPCPGEMVQVQFRAETRWDGEKGTVCAATSFMWTHTAASADIIAFRRVKKPEIVTLQGRIDCLGGWELTIDRLVGDRHRLTFEIVNGEPVNPRIERLKK